MTKTYTSMDLIDGKFVATVFDSTNNQEIYKTKPHRTQLQATQDVTSFLTSIPTNSKQATITNTTKFNTQTVPAVTTPVRQRCCGR